MRYAKQILALLLVLVMAVMLSVGVFAKSSTVAISGQFEDWDGHSIDKTEYDLISVTNVTKTLDKTAYLYRDSEVFKCLEVSGNTTLTSLMDELYFTAVQVNRKDKAYFDLNTYYQDKAHYVNDDGYEYYKKGSYIKLDKPGEYVIYAVFMGLDLGSVGYIKIVPDATQTLKATPTASKVLVNNVPVTFEAYTINGNNYFKLRDIAKVLSGTDKQFDITWDANYLFITLLSGKAYTEVGGELKAGDGKEKTAVISPARVYKDKGNTALAVTTYTINGNNYFKLRDIAQALDFGVTWDAATKTVGIDTKTGYTP